MGGAVQSFSSPMLAVGMQGSLSGFGTSGLGTFAKGGIVKFVSKNEGNYYYRRFDNAIGSFGWKFDKRFNEGTLFPLEKFDLDLYKDVKLKNGEVLFRYESDVMFGRMRPLIKLNLDKGLIYFMVDSDIDEPNFESKGIKAEYIVLEEGYDKKYAEGGQVVSEIESKYALAGKDSGGVWTYSKMTADEIAKEYNGSVQEDGSKWYVSLKTFAKGGKIGFEGLSNKVARAYKGKKVKPQYQDEYGKTYDAQEAKEVGDKVASKVYRQQLAKKGMMADGGSVEELQVGDIVTHKKGRAYGHGRIYKISAMGIYLEDKFGNKREQPYLFPNEFKKVKKMFADGGEAQVQIENQDVEFDEKHYKGLLSDFDLDGLPNVDDPDPFGNQDKKSIEQVKFSKTFKKVLDTKKDLDVELNRFVNKLQNSTSSDEKIYARSKTPFSILNKLVDSRLLDEKRGLKDLVGTTITFKNTEDLKKYMKKVRRGDLGKVVDFDDYYANPNDGYRAYHFIIEQDGVQIELQLKTDRMKEVNILSHDAYKNKTLNKEYMLYLTSLANDADNGNGFAKEQFNSVMQNKAEVKKMLNSKNN